MKVTSNNWVYSKWPIHKDMSTTKNIHQQLHKHNLTPINNYKYNESEQLTITSAQSQRPINNYMSTNKMINFCTKFLLIKILSELILTHTSSEFQDQHFSWLLICRHDSNPVPIFFYLSLHQISNTKLQWIISYWH